LALVPSSWGDYDLYGKVTFGDDPQICHLDTAVLHNGHVSIRIDPPFASDPQKAREVNTKWIPVNPGDHIVFKAWIKVDTIAGYQFNPDDVGTWRGARVGISYYGANDLIRDVVGPNGEILPSSEDTIASYVFWNTDGWVQQTIDCVVPNIIPHRITGESEVPKGIIAWFQVWGYPDNAPTSFGSGWMSDTELYINP
jgi:hypothetical protein